MVPRWLSVLVPRDALAVPMILATASGVLWTAPARAASLQEVSTGAWASGVPSYISMYIYVPDTLMSPPPIMVAAHYCGGSATSYFSFDSNVVSLANRYGFIMIFPQTTNPATSADCWDVGSKQSLTHNGGGDTQAVAQMVQYTVDHYGADATRVYAMGSSSGAMLTEALMGVYPEVFKAGAEMSGVPDGCWSDGWMPTTNWGGTCANGDDTMTAEAWGNLVRAQYPGYTGPRPRLWLWVGTADMTISPVNFQQAIFEWTNVLGLSATPTMTEPMTSYGTGQVWDNSCGFSVLEAWSLSGGGHAPVPTTDVATAIVDFFALDKSGPDPGAAECNDGGGSSTGGSSGSGGTSDGGGKDTGGSGGGGTSGGSGSGVEGSAGTSSGGASSVGVPGGSSGTSEGSGSGAGGGGGVVSNADGGSGGDRNGTARTGCACRTGPADDGFGATLLTPIGGMLGILVRRRRRTATRRVPRRLDMRSLLGDQSVSVRTESSLAASTNNRSGADLRAMLGK